MVKLKHKSRRSNNIEYAAIESVGSLLPSNMVQKITSFQAPEQTEESYEIPKMLNIRDEIARYYQTALEYWEEFAQVKDNNPRASEDFINKLLTQCLNFSSLEYNDKPIRLGEQVYPINYSVESGRIPVVVSPHFSSGSRRATIDEALEQFGDNQGRRSATQLLQQYLNAQDDSLWGLASDGLVFRLLRDNASLIRPVWIEINLEKIFTEGLFADFSAMWLLLHASRFGKHGRAVSDCFLEFWRERSRIEGVEVKEKLRLGVEKALVELGQGFLEHSANSTLLEKLKSGDVTGQTLFEELLRLVYSIIFLFVAEDRNLLHVKESSRKQRSIYSGGYSIGRLRDRCVKQAALDRNIDAWDGLRSTFRLLEKGSRKLGISELGGLFDSDTLSNLNQLKIENRRLLKAIWCIAWFRPDGEPLVRVNWRDMETEELGSVYESLLELIPEIHLDSRTFKFAIGGASGSKRKSTGSYYTPEELVNLVLEKTLEPVLDEAEAKVSDDPETELLKLTIIDPACGSGHFLLSAARRVAQRVIRIRAPENPSREVYQQVLRDVVRHCIYGVDRNPLAVELCKVALWIESIVPGKPLSWLDSKIRCGDSLVGVLDVDMLREGVPDGAYSNLIGDDKLIAVKLKKINRDFRRRSKESIGFIRELDAPTRIANVEERLLAMPENTLTDIKRKSQLFKKLRNSKFWQNLNNACNMYIAAFLLPKFGDIPSDFDFRQCIIPTSYSIWATLRGKEVPSKLVSDSNEVAQNNFAFHWQLEFPIVMNNGGFDIVIGNPPWQVSQFKDKDFFQSRDLEIAKLVGDKRKKAIQNLSNTNRQLYQSYIQEKRSIEATSVFIRKSGRFELTAVGKLNSYSLFSELFVQITRKSVGFARNSNLEQLGRSGLIIPTGIATDESKSKYFQHIVENKLLISLVDFENRKKLFPIHRQTRFSVLSLGLNLKSEFDFAFHLTSTNMLEEKDRVISMSFKQIQQFNPNTKTIPIIRSKMDAKILAKVYANYGVLVKEQLDNYNENNNPWGITFRQGLYNTTNDSSIFKKHVELLNMNFERDGTNWKHDDGETYVPLYEGKFVNLYDHRWGTFCDNIDSEKIRSVSFFEKSNPMYEPEPRYWVPQYDLCLNVALIPKQIKIKYQEKELNECFLLLIQWVLGKALFENSDISSVTELGNVCEKYLKMVFGSEWLPNLFGNDFPRWLQKRKRSALHYYKDNYISEEDLLFIKEEQNSEEFWRLLVERNQPRWLMVWRDITNSVDKRTVVGCIVPKYGVGNELSIWFPNPTINPCKIACLVSMLSSIVFDFFARCKVGGTHLSNFIAKQLPIIPPEKFSKQEIEYIVPRVLELTYTTHTMQKWAEDLSYYGKPFEFNLKRRAIIQSELDAFFAVKFNLTREDLLYILDPANIKGDNYPSETFTVLKNSEMKEFGEYRTQRLVVEAYDKLTGCKSWV